MKLSHTNSAPRSIHRSKAGPIFVTLAAFALFILHQDFWLWNDRTLVFGFMPIGLFYHACFSLACGVLWWCATIFAWPDDLEAWASDELESTLKTESERAGD